MKDLEKKTCRIALVQAEPVMFDKAASLDKALGRIKEAAAGGAELSVFPELCIPGYPVGMNFGFSVGKRTEDGRKDWKRYYDASVVAGETEFQQLAQAAQKTGAYISLGFSERDAVNGTHLLRKWWIRKVWERGKCRETTWQSPYHFPR